MMKEYKIFTAFLVTTIIIIPAVEMGVDFRWLSQSLLKN
jgi:hypothetical protein